MGKPKTFVITLAGNTPVYFAGSIIEGTVVMELSKSKKMEGISIVLSGKAYVHWTEERTTGTGEDERRETVDFTGSETVLKPMSIQLWGNGKDKEKLKAGRYEFPFKFELPSKLPTSYESHTGEVTGYIRYALKSMIELRDGCC